MNAKEFQFSGVKANGFLMLFASLILLGLAACSFFFNTPGIIVGIVSLIVSLMLIAGFVKLEPNEASVMVFFGKYVGVLKENGFFWVNPFLTKKRVSLRARNLNIEPIKVNDKVGNPVLIGLVLVWKLQDTYKAMFEIDSQTIASSATNKQGEIGNGIANKMKAFETFVRVQSDAALRQVAGLYAYDNNATGDNEPTLRSGGDVVNECLLKELNERLDMAGIEIIEARLNYLAYAPEIAAAMLRRQQAEAIISAREKIVEGAVSMVKMALEKIGEEGIVELDEDKKAAMVSNLLVVLCADDAPQPVVNAGTLHH